MQSVSKHFFNTYMDEAYASQVYLQQHSPFLESFGGTSPPLQKIQMQEAHIHCYQEVWKKGITHVLALMTTPS